MSGLMVVMGFVIAVVIMTAAIRFPAASARARTTIRTAAGVMSLVVLAVFIVLSSVRYVAEYQVGVVIKNVALKDLPEGRIIATGAEKGPQAEILGPGWNFGYWPVIYDVDKPVVTQIGKGEVGLMTTTDGLPLPPGDIYASEWSQGEFQQMLLAPHFLTDGRGYKGPQTSVLTPGTYRINPKLYIVEKAPVTNVEKATVGVVKSNVGDLPPSAAATPDALVDRGQRGIWREPLLPQEYYLNTKAYEITMISTAKRVIDYTRAAAAGAQREITVRTADGFDFPVDVRVEYEIKSMDAPLVVSLFGDDREEMRKRLHSAVRAIFRNNAEAVKALDYVNERSLQETQSLTKLADEMTKVGVTVTAVRIAGVAEDGSLDTILKTQTDRQIAEEEVKMFMQQQLAVEQKKELSRTEQEALEERRLATAKYEVQIAEQDKERLIIAATAEAEAIRIRAEAQAEAYRVVALHIGPGNAALLELLKIVGESGINITPRVMVIGQNGSAGNAQSAETTALIGTMLDSMLSREEPPAQHESP